MVSLQDGIPKPRPKWWEHLTVNKVLTGIQVGSFGFCWVAAFVSILVSDQTSGAKLFLIAGLLCITGVAAAAVKDFRKFG